MTEWRGLQKAIDAMDSQVELAKALGITKGAITRWKERGRRIPAERVLDIERVTGVSRHELRPDIYPDE